MRFAYADPPYLGLAEQFYGHLHPDAAAYDRIETHAALIDRLSAEYPDGWAYSLHVPALRHILPLCPEDVRVCAWVKPFASFRPNVRRAYAWEPVIVRGGRVLTRESPTVRDYVSCAIELGSAWKGKKAAGFCFWLFEFLGMNGDDEFVDLFPGSGAVNQAWEQWRGQHVLRLGPIKASQLSRCGICDELFPCAVECPNGCLDPDTDQPDVRVVVAA